ncbi:MAG: hypothetical protein ACRC33_22690 [Gemmataceae bacterium]
MVRPGEFVIDDDNYDLFLHPRVSHGVMARGLVPRDYAACPVGYLPCARPFDLPLIPESEWPARLAAQTAAQAQLSHVRDRGGPSGKPIPSTDQNGRGYCWCHSSTSACLIVRALNGQPFVDLSAYMVGCIIKGYRDQGGFGSEGVEFMAEHGIPSSEFWPQRAIARAHDTPDMRANARLHRITEWMDLAPRSKAQLVTCLLSGIPVVADFNWWGHSVLALDVVSLSPFRIRVWNSWGDSWSANGTGVLEGSKAIPDGMVAPRVLTASTT